MKGQVELIVIFAFILIAIVVVLIASSGFDTGGDTTDVTGLGQEKKLVRDSILNTIRNYAKEEVREVYRTGGLVSNESLVGYGVKEISVWSDCEKKGIPDIRGSLEKGIEDAIAGVFEPEMQFFGKDVRIGLGKLDVSVNIQEDGVRFDVDMPTFVEGSEIPQPYSVLINCRLKDILEVSEEVIDMNWKTSFFESATLNTILYSNPEEGWLPTVDLRTGCWNTLFKTESDVVNSLESFAEYTASHTAFNREILNLPQNPFYLLGVSESDLEVSFVYPDDWNLGNNFDVDPNPVVFHPKRILSFSSVCIGTTDVKYSLRYPVVAMVEDEVLGQLFNFAIMVNINDNKPGCGFKKGGTGSYHTKCLSESECLANLKVMDSHGLPVDRALVTFGGCSLGETDYLGLLTSPVPCMIGEVSVYRDGYKEHSKLLKSGDLSDYTVILEPGGKEIPVRFYGVPMEPGQEMSQWEYEDYSVSGQPRSIDMFSDDYFVLVYMKSEHDDNLMLYNIGPEGFTSGDSVTMEPGVFDVFGAVVNNRTGVTVGYTETTYLSEGDENELYVYLPVVEGISESIRPTENYKLEASFSKCSLNAISPGEQSVSVPCG